MIILLGLSIFIYFAVFGLLWEWGMQSRVSDFVSALPWLSWLILMPFIVIQILIWSL